MGLNWLLENHVPQRKRFHVWKSTARKAHLATPSRCSSYLRHGQRASDRRPGRQARRERSPFKPASAGPRSSARAGLTSHKEGATWEVPSSISIEKLYELSFPQLKGLGSGESSGRGSRLLGAPSGFNLFAPSRPKSPDSICGRA